MFERVDLSGFLDEFSFGPNGVAPGYAYTYDLDEAFARQSAYLTEDVIGSDYYRIGSFDRFPTNEVEEETISVYLSSNWVFDVSDYEVFVNLGLRYEETDIVSPAKSRVAEQVYWAGGAEWLTQFAAGGELVEVDYEGQYDLLLPMIDIKVDLTDDLVTRASWGQTITRPTLGDMLGNLALTPSPKLNSRSGSRGNPNLEPFKSTNLDLSLEYYYSEGSYAAVGLFWKDVDNWIDNTQVKTTFEGLHDVYLGERWNNAVAAIEGRGDQDQICRHRHWALALQNQIPLPPYQQKTNGDLLPQHRHPRLLNALCEYSILESLGTLCLNSYLQSSLHTATLWHLLQYQSSTCTLHP